MTLSVPVDLIKAYEKGLEGYIPDASVDAAFQGFLEQRGAYAFAAEAIEDYRFRDIGAGKLSLPYLAALSIYPGCLPGGAQQRGSCVAWNTRNALLVSYCAYLMYGDNAERFAPPQVSTVGIQNGVLSTEAIYWHRQHGGDGWQCSAAAEVVLKKAGMVVRKNYPEIGIDLTVYDKDVEGRWGASYPPENVEKVVGQNLCQNATVCKTYQEVRDMLAAGYAVSSCGGESFSFDRDECGVSKRTPQGWAHAMALVAVDDRPEMVSKYGCGLVLVQNSWGDAFHGNDIIKGTTLRIPVGSFWARWNDVDERYFVALGPSKGWPAATLPDWGLGGII